MKEGTPLFISIAKKKLPHLFIPILVLGFNLHFNGSIFSGLWFGITDVSPFLPHYFFPLFSHYRVAVMFLFSPTSLPRQKVIV